MAYEIRTESCWICKKSNEQCVELPPKTIMRLRNVYICKSCVNKMKKSFPTTKKVGTKNEDPIKSKKTKTKKKASKSKKTSDKKK